MTQLRVHGITALLAGLLLISCVSATGFTVGDGKIELVKGETKTFNIVIDAVPDGGLDWYRIGLLPGSGVAEITGVTCDPSVGGTPTVSSGTLEWHDTDHLLEVGDTRKNFVIATVTIKGVKSGTTDITWSYTELYDDWGNYDPSAWSYGKNVKIVVTDTPSPLDAAILTYTHGGSVPLGVDFIDDSTGSPVSWHWDFGDGATSNERNPTHIYRISGTNTLNTVTLTVTNAAGETDAATTTIGTTTYSSPDPFGTVGEGKIELVKGETKTFDITLTNAPVGGIDWYRVRLLPGSGVAEITGVTTDPSLGGTPTVSSGIVEWHDTDHRVEVGDKRKNFVIATVTVKGVNSGTTDIYPPEIELYDDWGNRVQTACFGAGVSIVVTETSVPLKAAILTYTHGGSVPLGVDFIDDSTGSPVSWHWDFGDGATSDERSPSHTYTTSGLNTKRIVSLTVTDAGGVTDTATTMIGTTSYSSPDPFVTASGGKIELVKGETKTFDITLTNAPVGGIDWYRIGLLPGSGVAEITGVTCDPSVGGTPTVSSGYVEWHDTDHLLEVADTRKNFVIATVTVKGVSSGTENIFNPFIELYDDWGNQVLVPSSGDVSIVVTETASPLKAAILSSTRGGTIPLVVYFTDNSTGSPVSWHWDFGDGVTSDERNPAHKYTTAGTHTVTLTITNAAGETDTTTFLVKTIELIRITTTTGSDAKIASSTGIITDAAAISNPAPDTLPDDVQLLVGLMEFSVSDVPPAGATVVTLTLPEGMTADSYVKFGKTPDNPTPHWYEFMYDGNTGAEIAGNIITLHYIDGARGDDDITANGVVSDPGGPVLKKETPKPVPEFPVVAFPVMMLSALAFIVIISRKEADEKP